MSHDYLMVIGDEDVPASSEEWFEVTNPATGEIVGRAPNASAEDVGRAMEAAQAGFEVWSSKTPFERATLMKAAADLVREEAERIATLGVEEEGKPLNQYIGDVLASANMLDYYAEEGNRVYGQVLPAMHAERDVFILREPVGVVVCIVPWNYPIALMMRGLTPALGAGCAVVVKPASATPLATIEFVKLLREAGLPPGVVNVVTGAGDESVGEALVSHPNTAKICFTGGVESGRCVMALAAEGIKGVVLELGGQCPAIVLADADLDVAVNGIVMQGYKNSGEVCNRVNRVYVEASVMDKFCEGLAEKVARITVGNGMDSPDMGPMISKEHLKKVEFHVRDAVAKGATVIAGGKKPKGAPYGKGAFFQATAITDCTHDMLVMTEETLGPVLGVMAVDSFEKALRYANETDFGLTAFLFTSNLHKAMKGMHALKAGVVYINDIHGTYLYCPYGGIKQSGLGRDWGRPGLDEYLEYKTVYFDWTTEPRGGYLCVHED
jgi:succinate-semialdehyde dehydrogenase/glutarate-semialdehyde dehydrogenase